LSGDWNNSGNFISSTSTLVLNGGVPGSNKLVNGPTTFNNFIVNGYYALTPGSHLVFLGDFEVSGFLESGFSNKTFYGNSNTSGVVSDDGISTFMGTRTQYLRFTGTFYSPYYSSSVVFKGTIAPVSESTSSPTFINLEMSNTSAQGLVSDVDITVLGNFLLSPGCTWTAGNLHHTFMGAFLNNGTILSSGKITFAPGPPLTVTPTSIIHIGSGSAFQSSGIVEFGGASELVIDGAPASFNNVIISNTNSAGITPVSNWNMTGKFSINSNAIFNAGNYSHSVGGNIESDGILNGNTSSFTMSSATGQISGSPGTIFHHLTITGSVTSNSDFYVDGDFMNNGTYDGSIGALIMTGSNPSIIGGTTTPSAIAQLTVSKTGGAVATVNVDINSLTALLINSGTLFTSTHGLFQNAGGGALIIFPGATLKLGGTNTLPAFSGYGLDVQSTVDYAGTAQTIANGAVYGNLAISTAGNKTAPSFLPLTIAGNFILTAGNFIANNNTHKIQGNWIMTGGTFNNTNSVIRFDGSLNQDIQTIAPFNSLNVAKTSDTLKLSGDITVNAILSFTNGKIQTGDHTVILPASGTVTGASQSTGWVFGNLQRNVAAGSNVSRTFVIGGAGYYSPATVLFASVTTTGNLKASAASTDHPQIDYSGIKKNYDVNRYWTLTNLGVGFTTATSTFNWAAFDVDAGATTTNFKSAIYNGSSWILPTSASALPTSITTTGLTSFGSFAVGEKSEIATWTGAAGTADWFTNNNWSGGLPATTVETLIPTTLLPGRVFPVINSGIAMVDTLILQNAATLTITNSTLQIKGGIINSGTLDAGNCSIEMTGSLSQVLVANTFKNNAVNHLIISNSSAAGVLLGGALDVYGSLIYSGVNMKLVTNDHLTLKSTALNTAWIGDMTGNTITGKVTVEHYISARKAWRFLSVPTNTVQTIKQTWQEGATITGEDLVTGFGTQLTSNRPTWVADGFDLYSPGGPSLKMHNPVSNSWAGVPNTNTGINARDGYMVFIRGDRTVNTINAVPKQTVLRTKGDLYTGDQAPVMVEPGKFASIGNPYPSTLDMRHISKTGMKDFFYVWDPNLGGAYGLGAYQVFSFNGSDYVITPGMGSYGASGSVSNFIQSGLAFFVQADIAGGSLSFHEASKTSGSTQVSVAGGFQGPELRTNLYGVNADSSTYMADGLFINYDDNYSNGVDGMDALKSTNVSENLSIKSGNALLVVERRNRIMLHDTIFLNIANTKVRQYRFEFAANQLNQPGLIGFLEDNFLHTSVPLNLDGSTIVDFNVVNIAGSYATDRFRIVFATAVVLPVSFTAVEAFRKNEAIVVEWKVENESNMKQYNVEKSLDGTHYTSRNTVAANNVTLSSYEWVDINPSENYNYYRIRSTDATGRKDYSKVVKVFIGAGKQTISVYPNPVLNGIINLQLTNAPGGIYGVKILNKMGQVIMSKLVNHVSGNSSESIQLDKNIACGIYPIEVSKPDGSKTTINVSVLK
jgi:hypothetical protein